MNYFYFKCKFYKFPNKSQINKYEYANICKFADTILREKIK